MKGSGSKDKKQKKERRGIYPGLSDGGRVVDFSLNFSEKREIYYEEGGGLSREEWKGSKRGNGDMSVGMV